MCWGVGLACQTWFPHATSSNSAISLLNTFTATDSHLFSCVCLLYVSCTDNEPQTIAPQSFCSLDLSLNFIDLYNESYFKNFVPLPDGSGGRSKHTVICIWSIVFIAVGSVAPQYSPFVSLAFKTVLCTFWFLTNYCSGNTVISLYSVLWMLLNFISIHY